MIFNFGGFNMRSVSVIVYKVKCATFQDPAVWCCFSLQVCIWRHSE